MGGYCSGNHGARSVTTDGLLFLDIRYLRRIGFFRSTPGKLRHEIVSWSRRGQPSGHVSVLFRGTAAPYPPEILLTYCAQHPGEPDGTDITEHIAIDTTPCQYGGERAWFLCPGCGDRRAVLFCVHGLFRCRGCRRIAYSSTRETAWDRAIRRALTIKRRMGGHTEGTVFDPEPKPPHMHWTTYLRLCDELDELNSASLRALLDRLDRR
jgi:hypothetical protein